jgi:hypothetical protein
MNRHDNSMAEKADVRLSARVRKGDSAHIQDLIAYRLARRGFLLGATAALGTSIMPLLGRDGRAIAGDSTLTFTELERVYDEKDHVAPGYSSDVLLRWGDPIVKGAPAFDPVDLTATAQEQQFGYNCDFIAYMPLPMGSNSSEHGLLCVNHEYTNAHVMWPGMTEDDGGTKLDKAQVEVAMAAHGHAVVEIKKQAGKWQVMPNGEYNRRISMSTPMRISGPAAGHDWMKTSADPSGTLVMGTNDNCGGGTTPWGTVLICEEGSAYYFGGDPAKTPIADHYARYGYDTDTDSNGWARFHNRFNVEMEPNEANRFEWVVEFDPYDPTSMPSKRTALGRFGHEAATTILNSDGRVVVYMGDDDYHEYVYRFVSNGTLNPSDRAANMNLLDDGVLSVARFNADGTVEWIPLVQGQGPLTPENGFSSQGDVVIQTKRAGDLVGATPMDRPEDFEANPVTGRVYLVLTKNKKRETVDAANPRPKNPTGHIIELIPPGEGSVLDHAAGSFKWEHFILAGDPTNPEHAAQYHPAVSANGWLANPDNIAFDPRGRLWIATDGAPSFDIADGLYGVDTTGPGRALPKLIYAAPTGAEVTGPCFTPDGQTLFVAVQHPAEDSETLEKVTTRWPDFDENLPPRPSVVVITRDGGGEVGA